MLMVHPRGVVMDIYPFAALTEEGIFRLSGSNVTIQKLKAGFDSGKY